MLASKLILIASFALHHASAENLPISHKFSKDFKIAANDSLVYSRSFNRRHEFAYASCDDRKQRCHVRVIRAEASDFKERACSLRQDLMSGRAGKLGLYLPNDEDLDSERVVQSWWHERDGLRENRLTGLSLTSCMTERYVFLPVRGEPTQTRVIPYGYPNFELVYSGPKGRERAKFVGSLGRVENGDSWDLDKRYKRTFGERGVETDSSRGIFYLGADGEADWTVIYLDSAGKRQRELGKIECSAGMKPVATSGAHGRYGICWTSSGKRVSCTQFEPSGRRTLEEASFDAPQSPQWMAVRNLEAAGILVATGTCKDGRCDEFYVTKLDDGGRKSASFEIDDLNAESRDCPDNLTMDVVEEAEKNLICFNFVSLNDEHGDRPGEKIVGKNLQYRRHCVDKADVDKMIK